MTEATPGTFVWDSTRPLLGAILYEMKRLDADSCRVEPKSVVIQRSRHLTPAIFPMIRVRGVMQFLTPQMLVAEQVDGTEVFVNALGGGRTDHVTDISNETGDLLAAGTPELPVQHLLNIAVFWDEPMRIVMHRPLLASTM